jgi:hypothetical protein
MIRLSLYIFLWFASIAIAIFATQNTYQVSLRFLTIESIKLPIGLLLIFCAGCGAACINLWQTTISFELPTVPKFSVFSTQNNPLKRQTTVQTAKAKKDIPRTTKKSKDGFDEDWDEDWG